jgi:hypothetical protein
MRAYLPEIRRSASGNRLLNGSLAMGMVMGLAAHLVAYLIRPSATWEPLALVVDLLYALGLALWTGVVVALFVQIIPEVKRRQLKEVLDALDADQREVPRARTNQSPDR